jgi:hypothetical protein
MKWKVFCIFFDSIAEAPEKAILPLTSEAAIDPGPGEFSLTNGKTGEHFSGPTIR